MLSGFRDKFQKRVTSFFQSNLRKQIRKLPKILKFVRIIHYYSKLFTGVLIGEGFAIRSPRSRRHAAVPDGRAVPVRGPLGRGDEGPPSASAATFFARAKRGRAVQNEYEKANR